MKYVKILRFNHRNTEKKKELEACIELLESGPDGGDSKEKAKGGKPQASAPPKVDASNVAVLSESIVNDLFGQLYQHLSGDEAVLAALKAKEQEIREAAYPTVENKLVLLRNSAYAGGFFARAPLQHHHV